MEDSQNSVTTEKVILSSLVQNESVLRKVVPFLKEEYFTDSIDRKVFIEIRDFVNKYNGPPNKEAMMIQISENDTFSESDYKEAKSLVGEVFGYKFPEERDEQWLVDTAEKFCKDKAIYLAVLESIQIIDGRSEVSKNHLPKLLQDALSVTFDTDIGHDYVEDSESRYDFYHKKEKKIPFDLEYFNQITKGGISPKTLNVVMAGTGVGKSLFMCHHAAGCLTAGYNVLYVTCEMAEERIAERIDANLMDITMDDLKELPKESFEKKMDRIKGRVSGTLIVKEFATATANVNHFRSLLEELKMKKKFVPDILYIDYINICAAARYNSSSNVNSYMYVKAIAEEIRGLAMEMELPIFTATQTNRTGFVSSDVGLEDTSESFGLPQTADLMVALMSTEELANNNQILVKQLKNRYNDVNNPARFIVGINRAKMKLYDAQPTVQDSIIDSTQSTYVKDGLEDKFKQGEKFTDWQFS